MGGEAGERREAQLGDVRGSGRVGGDEVVVGEIRTAEGQSGDVDRLTRADVLVDECARTAGDRKHVATDKTGEDHRTGVEHSRGVAVVDLIVGEDARDRRDILGGDGADGAGNRGTRETVAVHRFAGAARHGIVGAVQAADGHGLAGADVLIGVGAAGRHGQGLGHGVAVDAAADGIVRVEKVGRGVGAVVDLGDRTGQAERGHRGVGVEHPVARAKRGRREVGGAVLLVVVEEVAVVVARGRVMRSRIGAPDLPGLTRPHGQGTGAGVVVEETRVDLQVAGDGDRGVEGNAARSGVQSEVAEGGRAGRNLPGHVRGLQGHPVGALGAKLDARDALRVRERDRSSGGRRHQGESVAVGAGEDRVESVIGVEVEDRTGDEGGRTRREDVAVAELIGDAPVDGDRLGLEIDDARDAGLAAGLILDREGAGEGRERGERAVRQRVRSDVAASRADAQGPAAAEIAIEDHVAAAGGDGAVGAVDAEVAGIKSAVEGPAEIEAELVRGGGDVTPQQDGRGEETERGVTRTGIVEVDQEIDGGGGLQIDVVGGEGVAEGGDADLGKARRRQPGYRTDGAVDDLDGGRVEQPGAGGAARGGGGDREVLAESDLRRGGLDEAAVAAGGGAGVQPAVGRQRATFKVAEQDDAPLLAGRERAGLDDPVVVDGRGGKLIGRLGGEQDATAVGPDGAAVVDLRGEGAALDDHADESAEIQGHAIGGHESHGSAVGDQRTFVDDLRREHGNGATLTVAHGHDPAMVRDNPRARAIKDIVTSQKISVPHRQRGGDQAADLDLRAGAEDDPVRVDQEDAAIGRERALDRRGRVADDAVEGDGAGGGLDEAHALAGRDVEAGPVDDGAGAGLVDGQGVTGGADRGLPTLQLGAGRQGGGPQGQTRRQQHSPEGGATRVWATEETESVHCSKLGDHSRKC